MTGVRQLEYFLLFLSDGILGPAGDGIDQSIGDRPSGQGDNVVEVQFPHNIGAMCVGGASAHAQFSGDLLVAETFGNQLDNLPLARGQ